MESAPQERTIKPKRFTEEQIIGVLKEAEAGAKTTDLCRRHGISDAAFYNWKTKYAGMTVSEARRLKRKLPLLVDSDNWTLLAGELGPVFGQVKTRKRSLRRLGPDHD